MYVGLGIKSQMKALLGFDSVVYSSSYDRLTIVVGSSDKHGEEFLI